MRVVFRAPVRSAASITAALLALHAAPAPAISPQTLTDPVGDNCRDYTRLGNQCGPDITQVVFSAPGEGNLHADITYASLPVDVGVPQLAEYVELGIYPPGATTPHLFGIPATYRVAQTSPGRWTLQSISAGFQVVGPVTATVRPLGIELAVPLATLGDPSTHRYAVNAGSAGETIPEHPDLAPNTGLFDLAADAPAPTPTTTEGTTAVAPAIKALSGIPAKQRGNAVAGRLDITVGGDLTIEALVPAAKSKLKSIGKIIKRGLKAGTVSFRLPLPASVRKKLAGRKTQVTLRISLKPASGKAITQTRKVSLTVPR